jgi:hypothetical protein
MDIQYTYDCRLKQSYVYCMSLGIFLIVFSVENKHDVWQLSMYKLRQLTHKLNKV